MPRILHRVTLSLRAPLFLFLGAGPFYSGPAAAQSPLVLDFVTHAAFFSHETHQPKPLDPQVFVRDASAPVGVGPQNIRHTVGYRNALLSDVRQTALYAATGKPIGFTLGAWLGATGTVVLTPMASGQEKVVAVFSGLKPGGRYSLFENHFDQKPVGFTPLDGRGTDNSFTAGQDGRAAITIVAPQLLTDANAVLLVYHSDARSHGASRGDIGITAHHQLIAKIP